MKASKSMTMKAWTLKRRREIDDLVAGSGGDGAAASAGGGAPAEADPDGWTERHEAERTFQQKKRLKRAVEAMSQGTLLSSEQVDIFGSEEAAQDALRTHKAERHKNINKYMREKLLARAKQNQKPQTPTDVCQAKKIWIEESVDAVLSAEEVRSRLKALRAERISSRDDADVFLLRDVTRPSQRVMWNAMLGGLALISIPFFRGQAGPMVRYQAAVSLPRKVWFSDKFIEHHTALSLTICKRMEPSHFKWVIVNDVEFATIAANPRRRRSLILLVCSSDVVALRPSVPRKCLVTVADGIHKLAVIDRSRSTMGLSVAGK